MMQFPFFPPPLAFVNLVRCVYYFKSTATDDGKAAVVALSTGATAVSPVEKTPEAKFLHW